MQQLLEDKEIVAGYDDKKLLDEEALKLSLKFGFVTPVSSLVVEKPDGTDQTVDVVPADKVTNFVESQPEEVKVEKMTTSTMVPVDNLEQLHQELPWLKDVIGLNNDTILLSNSKCIQRYNVEVVFFSSSLTELLAPSIKTIIIF